METQLDLFDVGTLPMASTIDAEAYDADDERYSIFRKAETEGAGGTPKTLSPMNRFIAAMYETCLRAEIPIMSGDKCCRLLAWVYMYGGQYEIPCMPKLYNAILYAQRRLNIMGGTDKMDMELIPVLQRYARELEACGDYNPPQWVYDLLAEYDLKPLDNIFGKMDESKMPTRKKLREYLDEGFDE